MDQDKQYSLGIVIPCFNEGETVSRCVERLRQISDERVSLGIIIVDDGSTDRSLVIAQELTRQHEDTQSISLEGSQGKGAARGQDFR